MSHNTLSMLFESLSKRRLTQGFTSTSSFPEFSVIETSQLFISLVINQVYFHRSTGILWSMSQGVRTIYNCVLYTTEYGNIYNPLFGYDNEDFLICFSRVV